MKKPVVLISTFLAASQALAADGYITTPLSTIDRKLVVGPLRGATLAREVKADIGFRLFGRLLEFTQNAVMNKKCGALVQEYECGELPIGTLRPAGIGGVQMVKTAYAGVVTGIPKIGSVNYEFLMNRKPGQIPSLYPKMSLETKKLGIQTGSPSLSTSDTWYRFWSENGQSYTEICSHFPGFNLWHDQKTFKVGDAKVTVKVGNVQVLNPMACIVGRLSTDSAKLTPKLEAIDVTFTPMLIHDNGWFKGEVDGPLIFNAEIEKTHFKVKNLNSIFDKLFVEKVKPKLISKFNKVSTDLNKALPDMRQLLIDSCLAISLGGSGTSAEQNRLANDCRKAATGIRAVQIQAGTTVPENRAQPACDGRYSGRAVTASSDKAAPWYQEHATGCRFRVRGAVSADDYPWMFLKCNMDAFNLELNRAPSAAELGTSPLPTISAETRRWIAAACMATTLAPAMKQRGIPFVAPYKPRGLAAVSAGSIAGQVCVKADGTAGAFVKSAWNGSTYLCQ